MGVPHDRSLPRRSISWVEDDLSLVTKLYRHLAHVGHRSLAHMPVVWAAN
jgi:hypothetical protein